MKKIKIIMLATSLFSCISIASAAWFWSSDTDSPDTGTTHMKQADTPSAVDSSAEVNKKEEFDMIAFLKETKVRMERLEAKKLENELIIKSLEAYCNESGIDLDKIVAAARAIVNTADNKN